MNVICNDIFKRHTIVDSYAPLPPVIRTCFRRTIVPFNLEKTRIWLLKHLHLTSAK